MAKKKDFVVVSDFHSYEYPLSKIKNYYLDEYEKIYILGDVTDRGSKKDGTGGVEILLEIKELSEKYPGRIIYVPGNHDEFIIGTFLGGNKESYKRNLIYNGGEKTYDDLCKFYNKGKLDDFIYWLGKLPIQRSCVVDGQRYVFAHAVFNELLYSIYPNYCLLDYIYESNKLMRNRALNVLWYRKNDYGSVSVRELPTADSIMVVGHTPTIDRPDNINLEDINGDEIKVYCVDGGVTYDGVMLKYVSGENKVSGTLKNVHNGKTSDEDTTKNDLDSKSDNNLAVSTEEYDEKMKLLMNKVPYFLSIGPRGNTGFGSRVFDDGLRSWSKYKSTESISWNIIDQIILVLKEFGSDFPVNGINSGLESNSLKCVSSPLASYMKFFGNKFFSKKALEDIEELRKKYEIDEMLEEISDYASSNFKYSNDLLSSDINDEGLLHYYDYVLTCMFNHVILSIINKYDVYNAAGQLDAFLLGSYVNNGVEYSCKQYDYEWITSFGVARDFAKLLTPAGINRVVKLHGCNTPSEYIQLKLRNYYDPEDFKIQLSKMSDYVYNKKRH